MKTIEYTPTVFKAILNQDEYRKFVNNDGIYWDSYDDVMVEVDHLDTINEADDRVREIFEIDSDKTLEDVYEELAEENKYLNDEGRYFVNSEHFYMSYEGIKYAASYKVITDLIYAITMEGNVYCIFISSIGDKSLYTYAEREADKILEWSKDID